MSNTDTELEQQIDVLLSEIVTPVLLAISRDKEGETRRLGFDGTRRVAEFIQARDAEKREALLKAVGEATVPLDDGTELLVPADVINRIESIYRGTQQ